MASFAQLCFATALMFSPVGATDAAWAGIDKARLHDYSNITWDDDASDLFESDEDNEQHSNLSGRALFSRRLSTANCGEPTDIPSPRRRCSDGCKWKGTSPLCAGECGSGEENCESYGCYSGYKHLCCRIPERDTGHRRRTFDCSCLACGSGYVKKTDSTERATEYQARECCLQTCDADDFQCKPWNPVKKKGHTCSSNVCSQDECCSASPCGENITSDTSTESEFMNEFAKGYVLTSGISSTFSIFEVADSDSESCARRRTNYPGVPCYLKVTPGVRQKMVSSVTISKDFQSAMDLKLSTKSLKTEVRATASFKAFSLAGRAMQSTDQSTSDMEATYAGGENYFSASSLEYNIATLDLDVQNIKFTQLFIRLTKELPRDITASNYEPWRSFFMQFGTHFRQESNIGGTVEITVTIKKKYMTKLTESTAEDCIRLAASVSAKVTGIGGVEASSSSSGCYDKEERDMKDSFRSQSKTVRKIHGGDPRQFDCGGRDSAWARFTQSITPASSILQTTKLTPVHELFVLVEGVEQSLELKAVAETMLGLFYLQESKQVAGDQVMFQYGSTTSTTSTMSTIRTSTTTTSTTKKANILAAATNAPPAEVTTTGNVDLKISSAQATSLKAKPAEAKIAFANAIARTINVDPSKVTITAIYVDGVKIEGTRRLADATVKVEWSVRTSKAIDAAAMVPATLKTHVQDEAQAVGLDIVITADPVATVVPGIEKGAGQEFTAGACQQVLTMTITVYILALAF